jgi:hypothetical protein
MKTLLAILMGTGFDTVAALWQPAWWLAGTDSEPVSVSACGGRPAGSSE